MKHVSLTILVIALMTFMVAFAEDGDAPHSVDLKLSKTLTLNPSGTAPTVDVVPVATVNEPVSSVESTGSALPLTALLALLVLPVGYWLGRRQQQNLTETTIVSQHALNEQVLTLKDALMETGSGPRNEWQSSLTSLQSELREKSKYIDRMHDQGTSNTQLLAELEDALQEQVETTAGLKAEYQAALTEQVDIIQQQFDNETQTAAQKLEHQAQLGQQQLDEQSQQAQLALGAQSEKLHGRLDEQSSKAQRQLDDLKLLNEKTSSEREAFKKNLEQSEAALAKLSKENASVTTELESAVSALGSQTAQIKQLSSELDELQSSNDASVSELRKYVQENTELTQTLAQTREENQRIRNLLDQEKIDAEKHLGSEREKLAANLEAEKLALTQSSNQQAEVFNRKIQKLEQSLENRALQITTVEGDAKEQLANEQEKFTATLKAETLALTQSSSQQAAEFKRRIQELEQSLENRDAKLITVESDAKEQLATEQEKFATNLEAEKLSLTQSSSQQALEFKRKTRELEQSLEDGEAKLKAVEADFAHASDSADAALADRDHDLAVLVKKLASHAATEAALDELNQAHTGALTQLQTQSEQVTKLEEIVKESKVQLEQFEAAKLELNRKDTDLAQIQSIAVDSEQALNEARSALSDQAQLLEQHAKSTGSVEAENAVRLQEIEQQKTQLAAVTAQFEQEAQRASEAQEAQKTLEDKLIHQEQDTVLLLDNLKALEAEHERQNQLVTTLESSVEQLEADLSEREEENTHTLKQLALVANQTAELEAKIENSDLLDTHIQELEAQLVSEQEHRDETTATQKFLVEKRDMHAAEHEQELKALKLKMDNQTQANEHLKKTLDQARKYREELEENTHDLERENRELSKAGTKSRQELHVSNQALQDNVQKISERDHKMQELQNALESKTSKLASSKSELDSLFTKVDELTASVALMESSTDEAHTQDLSDKLDRARSDLNKSAKLFSETKAVGDEHERNVSALQEQLARAQKQLEDRKDRANTLGTQLIELSEQRDKNLKTIASLEEALDAIPPDLPPQKLPAASSNVAPNKDYEEAMRARENIIGALEHELRNADIKIAGLKQKLEDHQMGARAETRVDQPTDKPISSAELEKLKLALMEKTRLIQALSNDVKVNKDLVRVFENDSNMLYDTEVKLESLEEHSQFLEHELAKAVTENKTLKSEIEKAAKQLARHQNIGRTVSEDTRLEQLRSRLNSLESENRQQLDVIAQLRGLQERSN